MDEQIKNEVHSIVTKQRELAEQFGTNSATYKQYMENADKKMAHFDGKNEELVKSIELEKKNNEELKSRIAGLEDLASLGSGPNGNADMKSESEAVMNALLKNQWNDFIAEARNEKAAGRVFSAMAKNDYRDAEGASKMASVVHNYGTKASADILRSDIGELGGFLCPPEYSNEMNKNMIEYSPVRRYARVRRTASKNYKEPLRVGIPKATRPGEATAGGRSVSTYAMNDFTPKRMTNTIGVSHDELLFNSYNLANELMMDNSEAFAVKEGEEFYKGDGVNGGLGFTVDNNVPEFTSATNTLTFDDMINITGQLKQGYNPMYMFNRRTLAYLRTLKDQNDRYLWSGPFGDAAAGSPATINGIRYSSEFIEFDDYDVADGIPVLFADMSRFYQIVDRTDMTIIRDEYTKKVEGIVEYTMNKWCYGKPKIHEAGVRLKKKA